MIEKEIKMLDCRHEECQVAATFQQFPLGVAMGCTKQPPTTKNQKLDNSARGISAKCVTAVTRKQQWVMNITDWSN
jgi:hypothetical protein